MCWLHFLVLVWTISVSLAQNDSHMEAFKSMLHEAANDVYRQHMEQMSSPPPFDMPPHFLRSYVPKTGVLNREELLIASIREMPVFSDAEGISRLIYRRFNSTDYILGVRDQGVVMTRMEPTAGDHFAYTEETLVLNFVTDRWSVVKDLTVFRCLHKPHAALCVAILTENAKTSHVNIYEVKGHEGFLVSMIDLGVSSATSPYSAKKISHVQSEMGGSVLVLMDSPDSQPMLVYRQKGSKSLNNYIELHYPSAVDVVTFTVHGRGYIAVSNATTCHVFKMDAAARGHIEFDRLVFPGSDLLNLEYFRLGFYHFLALSGRERQFLYTWKSAEFSLKQAFAIPGVTQLYSMTLPSCRDDVILFFVQDGVVEIHVYNGKSETFVKSNTVVPSNFLISAGTLTSLTHKNKALVLFHDYTKNLLAFVLETRLEPVSDPVLDAGRDLYLLMGKIQALLENQNRQVTHIKDVLRDAVRPTGDQRISAFQNFEQLHLSEGATVGEVLEPIFVEWENSELTLEQYRAGTEQLEGKVRQLEDLVEDLQKRMPDIVRVDQPASIAGTKTFLGDVTGTSILALSVNLETAAGINVPDLQKEVYRLNRPQQIQGTLTFEKPLRILGNLDTEGPIGGVNISDIMTMDSDQTSYALMNFEKNLQVAGDLHIAGRLNDLDIGREVVTLTGIHNITGRKIFHNGMTVENVLTSLLDGVDVDDMYNRAFTKSGSQRLAGTMTFSKGLHASNIIVHGAVNGYNFTELADSIVRRDEFADITGHKTFNNVRINAPLTVNDRVNGLKIPDDLFFTDVPQQVTGNKHIIGKVVVDNVVARGRVNGLSLPSDVVTLSGDEDVDSQLYFTDGINVEGDIDVEGTVDGFDLSDVVREAVKLNETSQFKNAVFLGPVTITGDLSVQGLVNKVDLDEVIKDLVFKDAEGEVVVESEKSFGRLVADSMQVDHVNGYNIEVDFMRVHGDQEINGTKTFKEPVSFNSITINNGMLSGLDVQQLHDHRITLVIDDDDGREVEFTDYVIVEGDLVVHGTVGGLRIPDDLVLKSSKDPIRNKVFQNRVTVDNLLVNGNAEVQGSFGGVDLNKFFEDRVSLSGDQDIEGDVWLSDSQAGDVVLASGMVNGVDLKPFADNVMSKTKDQVVTGAKSFSGNTIVHGPITTELGINGVNLAELNSRAFKLRGENYVKESLHFDDVTVEDVNVIGFVNGVNLTRLDEESLKKTGAQLVEGINVFESGFHVEGDIDADTVNDMVLPEDVLLKSLPQTINGKFTIQSMGIAEDLHVSGLINGLDLSEVSQKLLTTDGDPYVESNVTFAAPVHVFGDVQVSGHVNGVDLSRLSQEVLMRGGDQEITGNKVLRGNVTITGDLDVKYVNGIEWHRFLEDIVRIDTDQIVPSSKIFMMDVEAREASVGVANVDFINDKSLQTLLDDAVFVDIPAVVTGTKEFRSPVEITGDMDAVLINGLKLRTDVITLMCNYDTPQVITGRKTFKKLTSFGDIHVGGKVNSHNLYELYTNTLLVDGNQTVTGQKTIHEEVVFKKNVHPATVNGMVLASDLVTLNTDQNIYGDFTFQGDVLIEKDLYVHGLLNGVNITQLADDAVYLDTEQTLEGAYVLDSALVTSDVAVSGLVNGIDLPRLDSNVTDFLKGVDQSVREVDRHSHETCQTVQLVQDSLTASYYSLDGFVVHQEIDSPASFVQKQSDSVNLVRLDNSESYGISEPQVWDSTVRRFVRGGESTRTAIAKTHVHRIGGSEIAVLIGVVDEDSHLTVDGQPDIGFPSGFRDFSVLSSGPQESVVALLYPYKGVCEVYRITATDSSSQVESYGSAAVGKESTSIALFEIQNSTYLAVSRHYAPPYIKGFCKIFGRSKEGWQRVQSVPVPAGTLVRHFPHRSFHYLAFVSAAPVHETREPKSIHIYRNSGSSETHFSLFQKVPFDDASGLETFHFGDVDEMYLVAWNETRIQVLEMQGESGLQDTFRLAGKCIQDVKTLVFGESIYMVVGQQNLKTGLSVSSVVYRGLTKGVKFTSESLTHC